MMESQKEDLHEVDAKKRHPKFHNTNESINFAALKSPFYSLPCFSINFL